jgi:hypothetical protein
MTRTEGSIDSENNNLTGYRTFYASEAKGSIKSMLKEH